MDQLLVWLWETSQGHGVDFIVIIVSISILWSVYTRFQRQLEQLILQTPTAAILIDAENAQLVMANSLAKQLLGIRKIGKSYFLPQNETQQELRSLIDGLGSDSNNQAYMIEWSISQHTKVRLDVCGKQTTFRGRSVWFVSLITHQSTSHEKLEETAVSSYVQKCF